MIIANITTYIGMDGDAEHYYCSLSQVENPSRLYPMPCNKKDRELQRKLTSVAEVTKLNKKDRWSGMKLGCYTNRFNSIEEIHSTLLETCGNEDLVTYYESSPFKEMLFISNGVNLGYKGLGEIWLNVPRSCWKDLLPNDLSEVKVKCLSCGTEHSLEDLIEDEIDYSIEKRTLYKFTVNKRDILDPCCSYPDLVWDTIL